MVGRRHTNRERWTFVIYVFLVVISSSSFLAAQSEKKNFAKGKIGKKIEAWMKEAGEKGFSGAIIAAKNGKVVAAIGVGYADEKQKIPNTPGTMFEIASLSKQVTGTAAVLLAQEGRLNLDDSIAKTLPGIPKSCEGITLRHLLQHTSGIPGTNAKGGGDDVTKVIPLFLEGGPKHKPGTHWEYWNQGYALATEIIARAAKKSFVEYCHAALFRKHKLKSTCFTGDKAPKGVPVAIGLSKGRPSRSALEHPYGSFGFQYRGMGGVVTTVWDLWRWDRALDKKWLKKEFRAELFRPGLDGYALGWKVKRVRNRMVQSHSGGVRGFCCEGRRFPESKSCVFVLANSDSAKIYDIATAIEQMLFEEKVTIILPKPGGAAEAKFLEGEYKIQDGSVLKIEVVGDNVRASVAWTSGSTSRMAIVKDGSKFVVTVNEDQYPMEYEKDEAGKAKTIKLWGRTFKR